MNSRGDFGLFPAQYVEIIEEEEAEEEHHAPPPAAARPPPPPEPEHVPEPEPAAPAAAPAEDAGPSARACWEYVAAEDNEISFPAEAIIEDIVSIMEKTNNNAGARLMDCHRASRMMSGGRERIMAIVVYS